MESEDSSDSLPIGWTCRYCGEEFNTDVREIQDGGVIVCPRCHRRLNDVKNEYEPEVT